MEALPQVLLAYLTIFIYSLFSINNDRKEVSMPLRRQSCRISACLQPHYGRGYCRLHWWRWKHHGDPFAIKRTPNGEGKGYVTTKRQGKTLQRHRLIFERHLGRPLASHEIVHHKDGNKRNNALENLELMTRATHAQHHTRLSPPRPRTFTDTHKMCPHCHQSLLHKFYARDRRGFPTGPCHQCRRILRAKTLVPKNILE